ncbi:MAG: GC-type dockerin domain-anchored protein [Phycisphaerales bacterium]
MKVIFVLPLIATSSAAFAQDYRIDVYSIDAGASTLTSDGTLSLSGTVGQPDAGALLGGGPFELAGGFWPAAVSSNTDVCVADIAAPIGVLNFFDVAAFIGLYNAGDLSADLAAPFGALNFFDVVSFFNAFNDGCP